MSWIILYCLYTLLQYNGWKTNDSNNKWKCAHSPNKTHASKWLNKPKIQLICTFFVCTYSFFNYLPLILMRLIFKAFPPFALFVSSHCPWLQCNARTHSHLLMRPSVRTSLELVTNASKPTIINFYYDVQFLLMQPFHLFIWTSFFLRENDPLICFIFWCYLRLHACKCWCTIWMREISSSMRSGFYLPISWNIRALLLKIRMYSKPFFMLKHFM